MKSLSLFNAVVGRESNTKPFVSTDGFVIMPSALWAKEAILKHYRERKLSGDELNKTFHKSWETVRNSSREALALQQIMHYFSTYGTNFEAEVYIPDEVLNVPECKVKFVVIHGLPKDEMRERGLDMLRSGIAMAEDTLNDLLTFLVDELGYVFTGQEGVRNREAIVKIADMYGVLPDNTEEVVRYCVFRATGQTSVIKSKEVIDKIKASSYNPAAILTKHGLVKVARVFNRYKPLLLAFKKNCPTTINRISKLSKSHHKPMVQNPLTMATQRLLVDEDKKALDKATPFALFRAASALYARLQGQTTFNYRIRNGKSFAKEGKSSRDLATVNYLFLMDYMRVRFSHVKGMKIFLPEGVEYGLPTSEKMFVEYIPTGTKFFGERLVAGIYWENSWGARDHDLSATSIGGRKVGWNARYSSHEITYSGDITNAPNGAVEYLHCDNGLRDPHLVQNNVYSGSDTAGYKIIVGKGDHVSRDYMMDPNNLMLEVKTNSIQKQTVLGMFLPEVNGQTFVLLNFGRGHLRVSNSVNGRVATQALLEQYRNSMSFNTLLLALEADVVDSPEEADHSFALAELDKDSFTKLFV